MEASALTPRVHPLLLPVHTQMVVEHRSHAELVGQVYDAWHPRVQVSEAVCVAYGKPIAEYIIALVLHHAGSDG